MKKLGFTLAEVLITLAIIGVVAAISIPSVVANTQQKEFQTGLRKAVSVLNSAITMNMAIDGESPYENKDLFNYLQKHMSVMESVTDLRQRYAVARGGGSQPNAAFYTTDGMRYEFSAELPTTSATYKFKLYESPVIGCIGNLSPFQNRLICGGCGSYGLINNPDDTTKPPCIITVDVNGDRKPSPTNVYCKSSACATKNKYHYSDANGIKLSDVFSIMITDKQAIPYGVAAQRAMYQAQAKNK